jgi:CO/xanthine dehydrogenase FAD-binding subunit
LNTAQSIKDSPLVSERSRILSQAAGVLGTLQIRNLATLGGNLANASPSAEFAPPLLVLEASVRCAGSGGERSIPVTELFLSPGKSALKPDEVLTEVQVPKSPPNTQALYLKHSLRRMDVSIAAAAVWITLDGDRCLQARVALGAVAPVPFRARKAEAFLEGKRLSGGASDGELFEEAGRLATAESTPIDDLRGYADYRKRIVGMLVKQGLEQAIVRASA